LKEIIGADILVDIISGTSAGGINGLMLAYALANNKDFGAFASLWRQHGDIDRLMRDPDKLPDQTRSLLDGEGYYHDKLARALRDVYAQPEAPPIEAHPSVPDEIDLFVTSTNVEGSIFTTFDDSGHEIDVKEHRSVFRLGWKGPCAVRSSM
jgi:predicted acylesterase/phospholipase RssA